MPQTTTKISRTLDKGQIIPAQVHSLVVLPFSLMCFGITNMPTHSTFLYYICNDAAAVQTIAIVVDISWTYLYHYQLDAN
ncbi:MAG: hypothetical protein ACRD5B_10505, partial [Nitrososphaeraceae archaeon]